MLGQLVLLVLLASAQAEQLGLLEQLALADKALLEQLVKWELLE
jgi:hypothetical protein